MRDTDMSRFREFGYRFVDWIADYMESIEGLPVTAQVEPGEILSKLAKSPPERGESLDAIFDDFKTVIVPGITHWQHPNWFAYFPANNSPPSVLAELLTAGIGAQCMIWQTSPAAAELEQAVMEWLRQMLGLPSQMAGVIQDTASTATLCALVTAREQATRFQSNLTGARRPLRVYASTEAHSSVEKGVKIAGYGKENLRLIPVDADYAMIAQRLEDALDEDRRKGFQPACVVATLGTTSSTAVDPLPQIGEICRRNGLWLHVDAAFAGSACILPEKKELLEGAHLIDSFVFNPHKWLLTNFDCSAYFVKDPQALIRAFEMHPEYLKTFDDPVVRNYRDWGIQLGRRFRALKLWFVIRHYGVEGLRRILREHIRLAGLFAGWVREHDLFELMAPVPFSLVCFRMNDGRQASALDALNQRLLEKANEGGKIFLTHTRLGGRYVLRMAIGQANTRERHVRAAWEWIASQAEQLRLLGESGGGA